MLLASAACARGTPDKSAQVDALLTPIATGISPGAAVLVAKGGQVLHRAGYGLADLEQRIPIGPQTAFRLASVSKQFTAMAVMLLAEEGTLGYDDSIVRLLPELSHLASPVTVRHLLHHTSGIPDYYLLLNMERFGPEPTNEELLPLLVEQEAPRFTPGEQFEYSNTGYDLLAILVERASGQPFSQFLHQRVFHPLGMENTLVYDKDRPVVANRALAYDYHEEGFQLRDYHRLNLIVGAGGIYSTVEDLYRWDQALYTERLVSASTLREAFTPATLASGEEAPYGFGWFIDEYKGRQRLSHSGGWVAFRAYIGRFPRECFTVIVLANFSGVRAERLGNRLTDIYLGGPPSAGEPTSLTSPGCPVGAP